MATSYFSVLITMATYSTPNRQPRDNTTQLHVQNTGQNQNNSDHIYIQVWRRRSSSIPYNKTVQRISANHRAYNLVRRFRENAQLI